MLEQIHSLFGAPEVLTHKGAPLYTRLQKMMREAITEKRLSSGEALPSEREIANAMGISRVTVRRAIDDLVEEGILTQRQGAGTFVSKRVEQPLNHLKSFTEVMGEQDRVVTSQWLGRSIRIPTTEEQQMLSLSKDDEVVMFHRLRLADMSPMAIEIATLPRKLLDNPFDVDDSLYSILGQKGLRPVKALQRIRAVSLDAERAELLAVPTDFATLYIERVGLLEDDTPIEFTRSWFAGDSYDFVAAIRIP